MKSQSARKNASIKTYLAFLKGELHAHIEMDPKLAHYPVHLLENRWMAETGNDVKTFVFADALNICKVVKIYGPAEQLETITPQMLEAYLRQMEGELHGIQN